MVFVKCQSEVVPAELGYLGQSNVAVRIPPKDEAVASLRSSAEAEFETRKAVERALRAGRPLLRLSGRSSASIIVLTLLDLCAEDEGGGGM